MLPISYYFWNSYKKSGYNRWKLDRDLYKKQIEQGKDGNAVIKKLVENVLDTQEKTVKDHVTNLEIEVNKIDKEIKQLQEAKSEELNQASQTFERKKQNLMQNQDEIVETYKRSSLMQEKTLRQIREMLWDFSEFLPIFTEEVKKILNTQKGALLDFRKWALTHNCTLTEKEIKEKIMIKKEQTPEEDEEISKKLRRSIWYAVILWIICLFDIFLWYVGIAWFLRTELTSEWSVILLWWFLALVLIPIAVVLVHFSLVAIKKWGIYKQLWIFAVFVVTWLLVFYASQSLGVEDVKLLTPFSLWNLFIVLQKNPEFLLRCFIIPSLFAWEIIVELIDWDLLLKSMSFGKILNFVSRGIYVLNSNKISNYAKEEQRALEKVITEMEDKEIPVWSLIKQDLSEVKSLFEPIRREQEKKLYEYTEKLNDINNQLIALTQEYAIEKDAIDKKYEDDIWELKTKKSINNEKINNLNHQFNQATIDVKEWLLIWLVDK